jgi:hypothetical protein
MRQKIAPAGRDTSEMLRDAKEPGLCSTHRRRVRSGCTHAGMGELDIFVETASEATGLVMCETVCELLLNAGGDRGKDVKAFELLRRSNDALTGRFNF